MERGRARAGLGWSLLVLACLALAACGDTTRWWMFQADARHGGRNPGDRLVYYADGQLIRGVDMTNGKLVWQAPIPGNGNPNAPGNSPGIEFELLVVPNKGYVHAFR